MDTHHAEVTYDDARICWQMDACLLTVQAEAFLVTTVCSAFLDGQAHWSLSLLQDKMIQAGYYESVSHETIRQTLKNELKPWQKQCWCIPPQQNAAFVCAMADVLDVFVRPLDPKRPFASWMKAANNCLPLELGQPLREDYE